MAQPAGVDKPFWVSLSPLEHFVSGHDTLPEAEAEARWLNHRVQEEGCPPHHVATPRRQVEARGSGQPSLHIASSPGRGQE